jgi:hypothetical protein
MWSSGPSSRFLSVFRAGLALKPRLDWRGFCFAPLLDRLEGLSSRPHVVRPSISAQMHQSAIRTDALLGRMHNLGVLGFSRAQWRLLRELRLRAIFHPGRVVSARGGRLSDCPCCQTRPNLEHAHAEMTHVAERHRRAGRVLGLHSITSSARARSVGAKDRSARLRRSAPEHWTSKR